MKIRTDFVTNSSSSSFVVFTIYCCKELIEYIEKLEEKYKFDIEPCSYNKVFWEDWGEGCSLEMMHETPIDDSCGHYPGDKTENGEYWGDYYGGSDYILHEPLETFIAIAEDMDIGDIGHNRIGYGKIKSSLFTDEEIKTLSELFEKYEDYCVCEYTIDNTD